MSAMSAFGGQKKAPTVIVTCNPDCVFQDKNEAFVIKCTLSDPDHVCNGTNPVFTITAKNEHGVTTTYTGQEVTINSGEINGFIQQFTATLSDSKGLCALSGNTCTVHIISFSSAVGTVGLENTAGVNGKPDKVKVTVSQLIANPKGGTAVLNLVWNAADFRKPGDATGTLRPKSDKSDILEDASYNFFPKTFPLPPGTLNITGTYTYGKCKPCPLTPPLNK
jgi:hypothetical protein